jgi:hypothetical protein
VYSNQGTDSGAAHQGHQDLSLGPQATSRAPSGNTGNQTRESACQVCSGEAGYAEARMEGDQVAEDLRNKLGAQHLPLRDQVLAALRTAIINGDYPPGERLTGSSGWEPRNEHPTRGPSTFSWSTLSSQVTVSEPSWPRSPITTLHPRRPTRTPRAGMEPASS